MMKIYFDTNQLYYIRKIAEEDHGSEYGDYDWAYRQFANDPLLVQDIRALCYIGSLYDQWGLDFSTSDAAFSELCLSDGLRAKATREVWSTIVESVCTDEPLVVPLLPGQQITGDMRLDFILDPMDRVIVRYFAASDADVLLTSDKDICSTNRY
jgi:hypothetical protein